MESFGGLKAGHDALRRSCIWVGVLSSLAAACSNSPAAVHEVPDAGDAGGGPRPHQDTEGGVAADSGGAQSWKLDAGSDARTADATVADATVGDAIYADPLNGDDAASGAAANPVRTLKRALQLVPKGGTVRLLEGTFGAASGDDFSSEIPAEVTIRGAEDAATILDGSGLEDGIVLAANATLRDLDIKNFRRAVAVQHGTVKLAGIRFSSNFQAITAWGDAIVGGDGLSIRDGNQGVQLGEASALDLVNSSISNMGETECGDGEGVYAQDVADIRLTNVTMTGIRGIAVEVRSLATASLTQCRIDHSGLGACGSSDVVDAYEQSSLSMSYTTIDSPRYAPGTIVRFRASTELHLVGSTLGGATSGTALEASGRAHIDSTTFKNNGVGARLSGEGRMDLEYCDFEGNSTTDLHVESRYTRLRRSHFNSGAIRSIYVAPSAAVDLGTSGDPGSNQLGQAGKLVLFAEDHAAPLTLSAAGNFWKQNAFGPYAPGSRVVGPSCAPDYQGNYCIGKNVNLDF
jgi:hypothetical protein